MINTLLTKDEELALIALAQSGDIAARDQLVDSQYRWVVKLAMRHIHRCRWTEVDDLIQAGLIGLLRAIEKFDPSVGVRLGTYATAWIRQKMQRELDTSCVVTVSHASTTKNEENKQLHWYAMNTSGLTPEATKELAARSTNETPYKIAAERDELDYMRRVARKALKRLYRAPREVIESQLRGETNNEISKRLGISVSAVTFSQRRGVKKLAEMVGAAK